MSKAECPYCTANLHHKTLKFVHSRYIIQYDKLSGQSLRIETKEYECPFCSGRLMVTGGRIIEAIDYD
jgi:DNA-directed RNA polymerase subunit RPC12/RpoP